MSEITLLLTQLDWAYARHSWHGTNLRGSIRGVSAADAVWRPGGGRHNVQELVVHAAYWKYVAWRRLTGEARGRFPLPGSNWFAREAADAALWRADVRLLDAMHQQLRTAIAALPPRALTRRPARGSDTALALISGAIAHDLYHAGQIQLLKRLRR